MTLCPQSVISFFVRATSVSASPPLALSSKLVKLSRLTKHNVLEFDYRYTASNRLGHVRGRYRRRRLPCATPRTSIAAIASCLSVNRSVVSRSAMSMSHSARRRVVVFRPLHVRLWRRVRPSATHSVYYTTHRSLNNDPATASLWGASIRRAWSLALLTRIFSERIAAVSVRVIDAHESRVSTRNPILYICKKVAQARTTIFRICQSSLSFSCNMAFTSGSSSRSSSASIFAITSLSPGSVSA